MVESLYLEFKELLDRGVSDMSMFNNKGDLIHQLEDIYGRFHSLISADNIHSEHDSLLLEMLMEMLVECGNRFLIHLKMIDQDSAIDELLKASVIIMRMIRNGFAICRAEIEVSKLICFTVEMKNILSNYLNRIRIYGEDSNEILVLVRCCLQIVANLSFSGIKNASVCLKTFCNIILRIIYDESEDEKLRDYATAALYSIVRCDDALMELNQNCPEFDVLILTHRLVAKLINSEGDTSNSEWSLFVLKLMMKSSDYLRLVWVSLPKQERIFLIEVLSLEMDKLGNQKIESKDAITDICNESNIDFLCFELSNHMASLIVDQRQVIQTKDSYLLSLLSHISPYFHLLSGMKNKAFLLNHSVDLLKILHNASKQKDGTINDERILLGEIKLDLMRMVANLVYRNKEHQDMLRDNGGFNLILDMTAIDPICPTIQQWALFAISNLCEGNKENQNYISSLKLERLADVSRDLNATGIKVEVRNGKLHFLKPEE